MRASARELRRLCECRLEGYDFGTIILDGKSIKLLTCINEKLRKNNLPEITEKSTYKILNEN